MASLLRMLRIVTAISSEGGTCVEYSGSFPGRGTCSGLVSEGVSSSVRVFTVWDVAAENAARGRPSLEGRRLFGRAMSFGEPEEGLSSNGDRCDVCTGDSDRLTLEIVGDPERIVWAGEVGRASRELPAAADGLAGLGRVVIRGTAGEPGLVTPAVKRATAGAMAEEAAGSDAVSCFSWKLGPGTRRRRSSSCVLSFEGSGPTRDQTFSPTRVYPSLQD